MHTSPDPAGLALAVSRIYRCHSVRDLQQAFLRVAPAFVDADAFGMYLFDEQLQAWTVVSHQAPQDFLDQYEALRERDPLFQQVLRDKRITHSLQMFGEREWRSQPLRRFLSHWRLEYSMQAPLIVDGRIHGTLNFARRPRNYFSHACLETARFLTCEINAALTGIIEVQNLRTELARLRAAGTGPPRFAGRAQQTLALAVAGHSNRVIAGRLGISENTVRYHLKAIYRALGVSNRAQLVRRVCARPSEH